MKLERLDHFGLEVNELASAERFYTEVLGLTVVAHLGDQTLLQCGPQNLALFQVKRPPLTPEQRAELGIHDGFLRLSVGIEDPADIIADLERGLAAA